MKAARAVAARDNLHRLLHAVNFRAVGQQRFARAQLHVDEPQAKVLFAAALRHKLRRRSCQGRACKDLHRTFVHQQLGACMRQQHHTLAFKGVDGIAVRLKKSAALLQRHAVGLGIEFWRDVKALIVAFHSRKALLGLLHALEHGIVGVKALGIFPVAERAVKRRFGIFQIALGAVYLVFFAWCRHSFPVYFLILF